MNAPAPATRPVNIAVAGAGLIGREHIRVISANPQCRLAAIVDPTPAGQEMAQQHGAAWHPDLGALFAAGGSGTTPGADAVVLSTPNQFHHAHALQCIAQGLPILLEKPIATTVADAEDIIAQAQAHDTPVLIGHHRAHSPIMAHAREVIAQGQLGQIVAVQGSALFFKPDHYFEDGPWRKEPGGGPVSLNMIHEIHNLRMLCGEIVAVQAFASNATRGFAVEDTAVINLRFASGALGTFVLSDTAASARSWEQTSQENKSYSTFEDEDCYHIAGTQGSLSVPTMRLKRFEDGAQRSWWQPMSCTTLPLQREDPLVRQMQHFVQVVRRQQAPLVSARDGLQNLRVSEAIMQAAAQSTSGAGVVSIAQ